MFPLFISFKSPSGSGGFDVGSYLSLKRMVLLEFLESRCFVYSSIMKPSCHEAFNRFIFTENFSDVVFRRLQNHTKFNDLSLSYGRVKNLCHQSMMNIFVFQASNFGIECSTGLRFNIPKVY